jgi:Holliday junction resolvase RusA-like endonuclease
MIIALVAEQGWNNIPLDVAHITVSWGVKDRVRRDTDNFVGRTKPYIDGLVKAQVIADDSRHHVMYTYKWHDAVSSETVITINSEEGEQA